MLTRDVSSRKPLNCDHFCTSNFNFLSGFQKVDEFRRKQLLSSFVSRQERLFIPRSPSRPLSCRVAHHRERRPCSFFVPRIALRPLRQVPTADTPQTNATLVRREAALIRPVDSGSPAGPPPELVPIEPHGAVTHAIDREAEATMAILVHRIGTTAIGPRTRN
jgi:hypothetical protein